MPFCLHRLIQPAPLIHLIFNKNKICGLRHIRYILCKLCSGVLEKTGVLKHDQTALREKRQRLRKIDDFFDIRVLSLITGKIHGIPLGNHGLDETFFVLFLQISLLPVHKINLFKLSGFQIFIQAFHNSSIIKEFSPF